MDKAKAIIWKTNIFIFSNYLNFKIYVYNIGLKSSLDIIGRFSFRNILGLVHNGFSLNSMSLDSNGSSRFDSSKKKRKKTYVENK